MNVSRRFKDKKRAFSARGYVGKDGHCKENNPKRFVSTSDERHYRCVLFVPRVSFDFVVFFNLLSDLWLIPTV